MVRKWSTVPISLSYTLPPSAARAAAAAAPPPLPPLLALLRSVLAAKDTKRSRQEARRALL
jgi:hypothetical protein